MAEIPSKSKPMSDVSFGKQIAFSRSYDITFEVQKTIHRRSIYGPATPIEEGNYFRPPSVQHAIRSLQAHTRIFSLSHCHHLYQLWTGLQNAS
ncbi:predicted protein [Sclerotinia sclerotiorum 1980 UF-70]|uniref:Uncharacterized protein n=1 Tax=Sclerotinia sclerotiorum (strain ATCC 18683 / 1980 / Ss-1) TaxID=665079 RepID=A7EB34_SCLS1|nr:predicted protein [Sclerotinia sclerotiorum 1980 UF-70]EDN99662.1 predicted protein [Sclerotinia sclerotiorum 1980 UF-70]